MGVSMGSGKLSSILTCMESTLSFMLAPHQLRVPQGHASLGVCLMVEVFSHARSPGFRPQHQMNENSSSSSGCTPRMSRICLFSAVDTPRCPWCECSLRKSQFTPLFQALPGWRSLYPQAQGSWRSVHSSRDYGRTQTPGLSPCHHFLLLSNQVCQDLG